MNPGISADFGPWIADRLAPLTITLLNRTQFTRPGYIEPFTKGYLFMNDAYFKQHAARVRDIAGLADPFTKKRLLALAEKYDPAKPLRATPLPAVAINGEHAGRNGGDAG
jgi:hypothetical protein